MSVTPLQEIENAVHEGFGDRSPTKEEAGEFIQEKYPRMDGGAAIAIALAAFILQGWQVYRTEQERRERLKGSGGVEHLPTMQKPGDQEGCNRKVRLREQPHLVVKLNAMTPNKRLRRSLMRDVGLSQVSPI